METEVGQSARILIQNNWYKCTVIAVDDFSHYSGNTIRRFTCKLRNGTVTYCGQNSIRFPTPTPGGTP